MSHQKRIVIDFDDTLAFTTNRDWANAIPNTVLIKKINGLHDQGWTIDIFTARGSISCATRAEAAEKYQPEMEEWLLKHAVKYDSISFDKPLAAYYIDDKGHTPESFIEMDIRNLEGGLSGSDIYTDGNIVHKTDERAHDVAKWYRHASFVVKVPHVTRVVGTTLSMEYINHDEDFPYKNFYVALGLVLSTLEQFNFIDPINSADWQSYVNRISDHVKLANVSEFYAVTNHLNAMTPPKNTFGHGDFGVTNMLFKDNDITLIDPIPEVFSSISLDGAKFIASLYINNYTKPSIKVATDTLKCFIKNHMSEFDFDMLIKAELIRVYKYHPDKAFIMECVNRVS